MLFPLTSCEREAAERLLENYVDRFGPAPHVIPIRPRGVSPKCLSTRSIDEEDIKPHNTIESRSVPSADRSIFWLRQSLSPFHYGFRMADFPLA